MRIEPQSLIDDFFKVYWFFIHVVVLTPYIPHFFPHTVLGEIEGQILAF
jgi:hypothetical protein